MKRRILAKVLWAVAFVALASHWAAMSGLAAEKFIIVQSTTSTQNSGLFDHILPQFTKKTGVEVRVVAVGTGQALKNARNGDGDVLHSDSLVQEPEQLAQRSIETPDCIEKFRAVGTVLVTDSIYRRSAQSEHIHMLIFTEPFVLDDGLGELHQIRVQERRFVE